MVIGDGPIVDVLSCVVADIRVKLPDVEVQPQAAGESVKIEAGGVPSGLMPMAKASMNRLRQQAARR